MSCFLSSFDEFCSVVSEKKSKLAQPFRSKGGHLVFPICLQNTNLVDVSCYLSNFVEFCPAGSEKKSKMSQQIRDQGSHLVFPIGPKKKKKQKLGRGRWDIDSCQISLNSVQRFQKSQTRLSQSESRVTILFFWSAQNFVEDVEILFPVKFRWISGRSENRMVAQASEWLRHNYAPLEKGGHIALHISVGQLVCPSVCQSVGMSVSLNLEQLITQEHFVPEASNLVGTR